MRHGLAACVLFLLTFGCRSWVEVEHATAVSPDGSSKVTVFKSCIMADCGLRVILQDGGARKILYDLRGDHVPQAAEVAWTKSRLAVLVCDPALARGKLEIVIGYDRVKHEKATGRWVREILAATLRKRYSLSEDFRLWPPPGLGFQNNYNDPVRWICEPGSNDVYFKDLARGQTKVLPPIELSDDFDGK